MEIDSMLLLRWRNGCWAAGLNSGSSFLSCSHTTTKSEYSWGKVSRRNHSFTRKQSLVWLQPQHATRERPRPSHLNGAIVCFVFNWRKSCSYNHVSTALTIPGERVQSFAHPNSLRKQHATDIRSLRSHSSHRRFRGMIIDDCHTNPELSFSRTKDKKHEMDSNSTKAEIIVKLLVGGSRIRW